MTVILPPLCVAHRLDPRLLPQEGELADVIRVVLEQERDHAERGPGRDGELPGVRLREVLGGELLEALAQIAGDALPLRADLVERGEVPRLLHRLCRDRK